MTERSIQERIHGLSGKQACYVVKALTQELFLALPTVPSNDEMAAQVERLAGTAGVPLDLRSREDWAEIEFPTGDSGELARSLLDGMAAQPAFRDLIEGTLGRYQDKALDMGILSAGVAIALVWLVVTSDIEITLPWIKIGKRGLSPDQQSKLAGKVFPKLAGTLAKSDPT